MLGARPLMGRVFTESEGLSGTDVIVFSHSMWQRYFRGDPDVVGRIVMLDGRGYLAIGVMNVGFQFPDASTQFALLPTAAASPRRNSNNCAWGRISRGWSSNDLSFRTVRGRLHNGDLYGQLSLVDDAHLQALQNQ
jgi:hypothetical protein